MVRQSLRRKAGATKNVEAQSRSAALAHVRREARSRHGDRGGGIAVDARDGATETSTSQEIDTTKVSVTKHFGHSKVRESKPGLSGSTIRNAIVSPHFWHRGPFVQILSSEGDGFLENDGCLRSDHQRVFLKMKLAQCLPRAGTKSLPEVWSDPVTLRRHF